MSPMLRRIAIVVVVALLAFWGLFEALTTRPGPVSKAIGVAVEDSKGRPVTIAKLTHFQWDEMFVVGGYAAATDDMRRKWCEHATFSAEQCSDVKFAPVGDGWETLVFRYRGKLVHSESHLRGNGTWHPFPRKQPLLPSDAVFDVMLDRDVSRSGKRWHYLVRPGDQPPPGSVPVAQAAGRP